MGFKIDLGHVDVELDLGVMCPPTSKGESEYACY